MLANYSWKWGFPCCMTDIPSEALLKNLFSLCHLLSIAFSFLLRGRILCPLTLLGVRLTSGLNMCKSCTCCNSLIEFMCRSILLCLEILFPWSHPSSPLAFTVFPFPHRSLRPKKRNLRKTSHLGENAPTFLPFYTLFSCRFLC